MTRLILWRHGRTEWNFMRRIQGQSDVDLDEVGLAQAASAAQGLAPFAPDLIVSSDLIRASRTAGFLAELTGLKVTVDARLRERHFGRWQGLTDAEIQEQFPIEWAAHRKGDQGAEPSLEPVPEVAARMVAAVRDTAEQLAGTGTAVIVTHGGAARACVATLLGLPMPLWHGLGALANCAITDLRHTERGWSMHAHNLIPGKP